MKRELEQMKLQEVELIEQVDESEEKMQLEREPLQEATL
jgi:hypothetical protein